MEPVSSSVYRQHANERLNSRLGLQPMEFTRIDPFDLINRHLRRLRARRRRIDRRLLFQNLDVELDVAHSKLNLYSPEHCSGGGIVYWADRYSAAPLNKGPLGTYYLPMDLDGKKVEASLETSRTDAELTTDVSKKLYGFDETSAGIEHRSSDTGRSIAHYRAMTISTEDLKIVNADVRLEHARSYCVLGHSRDKAKAALHDGCYGSEAPRKLGMNVISKMHLYFATKENMLYFTAADAGHESASAPSTPTPQPTETAAPASDSANH